MRKLLRNAGSRIAQRKEFDRSRRHLGLQLTVGPYIGKQAGKPHRERLQHGGRQTFGHRCACEHVTFRQVAMHTLSILLSDEADRSVSAVVQSGTFGAFSYDRKRRHGRVCQPKQIVQIADILACNQLAYGHRPYSPISVPREFRNDVGEQLYSIWYHRRARYPVTFTVLASQGVRTADQVTTSLQRLHVTSCGVSADNRSEL